METKELTESEKAKSAVLKFLSVRPRSRAEIVKKLQTKRYPAAVIEETVVLLTKQGLVDDEKFAKLFANSQVYSRPTGSRKLAFDLKQKGLSAELIEKTISGIPDYDEKKMARELVIKRLRSMKGVSEEAKKRRLFSFLQRRGFSTNVIFEALKIQNED